MLESYLIFTYKYCVCVHAFLTSIIISSMDLSATECFTDLDKPNMVKISQGGMVLGLNQFLPLPQLPQKMILASKVVESNLKIIISLPLYKSVTHSVYILMSVCISDFRVRFLQSNTFLTASQG